MTHETKEEYETEKVELMAKYTDLKQKYETKEDELNQKNITFEKDYALMKQQISFSDKKVEEM